MWDGRCPLVPVFPKSLVNSLGSTNNLTPNGPNGIDKPPTRPLFRLGFAIPSRVSHPIYRIHIPWQAMLSICRSFLLTQTHSQYLEGTKRARRVSFCVCLWGCGLMNTRKHRSMACYRCGLSKTFSRLPKLLATLVGRSLESNERLLECQTVEFRLCRTTLGSTIGFDGISPFFFRPPGGNYREDTMSPRCTNHIAFTATYTESGCLG